MACPARLPELVVEGTVVWLLSLHMPRSIALLQLRYAGDLTASLLPYSGSSATTETEDRPHPLSSATRRHADHRLRHVFRPPRHLDLVPGPDSKSRTLSVPAYHFREHNIPWLFIAGVMHCPVSQLALLPSCPAIDRSNFVRSRLIAAMSQEYTALGLRDEGSSRVIARLNTCGVQDFKT